METQIFVFVEREFSFINMFILLSANGWEI
jgi:hypothetical protein